MQLLRHSSLDSKKVLTTTTIILVCGLSLGLVLYVGRHTRTVEGMLQRYRLAGALLSVGLYGLLGASPIPSEPLTIINGAVFGPLAGTLIAGTGNTLAAVVEYIIGAGISSAAEFEAKRQKLPFGLGRLPVDSPWFLIGGRMVPGYGSKVVSVMGGMYRVPLWRYIWTTAIPTFVGAALFAYGGFGLLTLLP